MATTLGGLFVQGGWVMWPLLIFSVITWAVVLERAFVFFSLRPRLNRLSSAVLNCLKSGDASAAKQLCHAEKPAVSEVFMGVLDSKRGKEAAERVTERNRARLIAYLRKNLWVLGTIGSVSPFIGLLGTVIGIVRAFHSMSREGSGGFTVVASGISEALIATAAGLVVAIVALLTYNIFTTAANQMTLGLKFTLEELLDQTFEPATKSR